MPDRYPLSWPTAWPRTPASKRSHGEFKVSFAQARDELLSELERLGSVNVVISSNIPLRGDGLPMAKYSEPSDPGMAVYFQLNGKPHVLACDRWLTVRDNLRAIGSHVAAFRGMTRWGVGSLEQAFAGYQSLPARRPKEFLWWQILQVPPDAPLPTIKAAYKRLALHHHPDTGGNSDRMSEINRAWEEAQRVRR